jgi:RNA polymerase sigma-70 factor (ECF subfamily)
MSGSLHDADDLLQESLLKAWKGLGSYEGRASFRTWLYKVATNACLDALEKRGPRSLPTELGPAHDPAAPFGAPRLDPIWLEPASEALIADAPECEASPGREATKGDAPDARYDARESVALAFLAAIQLLPPKQRAVLILRDVLGWQASECAELLELSVAAVNSALQRARETVESRAKTRTAPRERPSAALSDLLSRYVHAWEHADVKALVALLKEDAILAMPPMPEWFQGAAAIGASIGAMVLTPEARGNLRLVPTTANGAPAFMAYQRDPAIGAFKPAALHVLEVEGDRIAAITAFVDPRLVAEFGLPTELVVPSGP